MLAVRFHSFGEPSVLQLDEIPDPRPPTGDELLVRVAASSVNGTDLGLRRGDVKIATWGRMPVVTGFDLAGEVLSCGPQVTAFSPGDRVMALLGHGGGGQAEQVLVSQHRAALVPRTWSLAQAAILPLAGLTALQALHGLAGLGARRSVTRVLVIGASGGIGSFAVQLANRAGAHVTAVASQEKLDYVRGLGADELVDYRSRDVATLGQQWDVILDVPGGGRFRQLSGLLHVDGVLVSTRPLTPDVLRAGLPQRWRTDRRRFAAVTTRPRSYDLAHLAALVDRGQLRSTLDGTYPASAAADAHRHAEGPVRGKVVLTFGAGA